jgi:general secretion pathway protein D
MSAHQHLPPLQDLPLKALALACLAVIAGCSTPPPRVPQALDFPRVGTNRSEGNLGEPRLDGIGATVIRATPKPPEMIGGNLRPIAPKAVASEEGGDLTVSFDQMAIPGFIQAVYGGVLKLNYSLDPAVSARTDLITFRTPKALSAAKLTEVSGQLLKSYGIAAQDFGGVLRIVPDTNTNSTLPLVRRGRAQPGVPLPLRPIFHYIETDAVRPSSLVPNINAIMGTKVTLTADSFGGLLVSGQPDDVNVALELIQVFDQPSLRAQNTNRIIPRYWGAAEFSTRLSEVLRMEGYGVGNQPNAGEPISILSIPPINSVIVFSTSKEVLAHVLDWVQELDQLPAVQAGNAYFNYPVRNADAQELAKSLNDLIGGVASAPVAGVGTTAGAASTAVRSGKRVVVNNATNSLIFQGGSQEDYRQWLSLLSQLDKPVKSALIDVLVAEVTLNDNNDLGFAWQLDQLGTGAIKTTYSALAGGAGLNINALIGGSSLRTVAIKALASNTQARVVSNPKVLTRNGESANISVGQDVPIITSQGVTTSSGVLGSSGTTNVVPQTVQYRNTGVILRVRPIIHAGDRIDIEINQEVSGAVGTVTGVGSSPTINRSSIDTKLSMRDGATVMLGGLISEDTSDSNTGVPGLKDIPGLGNLFRNTAKERKRKELVILVTPYILNDSTDAEAATDSFNNSLGAWADGVRGRVEAARIARKARADQVGNTLAAEDAASAATPARSIITPLKPSTPPVAKPMSAPAVAAPRVQPTAAETTPSAPTSARTSGPTSVPRMINLGNQTGAPESAASSSTASAQSNANGNPAQDPNRTLPPGVKPAPSVIDGFATPAGSTLVDDPKLKEELLQMLRRKP